ncbi:MarR family transcriptional regulator [Longimycelium tulufanense]|uniref:MarR family transcriptional regulator n=1 Tax=Longimycelium tulufanense TaxID=907463 RepID=A0A8J3CBK6_9PSEU|nr:MarR family transcriptional regulator [Longimycelium tulufanense]GGM44927.1 MarR family transcriptional regulator [Longimycelium tulufanense]
MSQANAAVSPPTEPELAVADAIGMELVRLMRLMACAHAQIAKANPDGLEKAGYILLSTLIESGPLRLGELAEKVYVDASTASRQVADLVKAGLVERQADPADGRASLLALTAAGRELLEHSRHRRSEHIARMVATWPAADRLELARLLARFTGAYEEYLPSLITELMEDIRSGGEN